jgi:hypothetical protein
MPLAARLAAMLTARRTLHAPRTRRRADPQGSAAERFAAFFVGGAPRLRTEEVVYSAGDRFRLQTAAGGMVHLQLGERRPPGMRPA